MGVSFVPVRALALHGRDRSLTRLSLPERFVRELVVVGRKHRKTPEHLTRFVDSVLFWRPVIMAAERYAPPPWTERCHRAQQCLTAVFSMDFEPRYRLLRVTDC